MIYNDPLTIHSGSFNQQEKTPNVATQQLTGILSMFSHHWPLGLTEARRKNHWANLR